MEVLESNLDLILSEWSGVELCCINNTGTNDLTWEIECIRCYHGGGFVQWVEILQRLILLGLNTFLHFFGICRIKVEVVSGRDSDSVSVLVFFIDPFAHTSAIISWDSSILHEFNASWLKRGTSLWSIISNGQNSCIVNRHHGDSRVNWVVVTSDVLVGIGKGLTEVPSWSIVKNSLLHFKSIWVSIECLVIVKVVNLPFSDDFVSVVFNDWEWIEVDVEFNWS